MSDHRVVIDMIGGNCPVQAEGTVDGKPFYFRARGERWTMSIGGPDVIMSPAWFYEEKYGEWPAAGWMTEDEALAFIHKAVGAYRWALTGQPPHRSRPQQIGERE